ncbi:MAG: hypothetical protein ABWW65_02890 [Thermoprotei archaeon]
MTGKADRGLYVKMPNGKWIRVKGKYGGIVARGRTRKSTQASTLIAESVNSFKVTNKHYDSFYISSTSVTKYLYRLIEEKLHEKNLIIVEYIDPEKYRVKIYTNDNRPRSIAEEMGIIRQQSKTRT